MVLGFCPESIRRTGMQQHCLKDNDNQGALRMSCNLVPRWTVGLRTLCCTAALVGTVGPVSAKVSQEQADRLLPGGDLTPSGAIRAGNAEGTIPEWTGGLPLKVVPVGDRHEDPFKDDKPLFTITADNYEDHADRLTEGMKAMFRKFPETFRMHVYPTRRSFSMPEKLYAETYRNATEVILVDHDNYSVRLESGGYPTGGYPFPIPQHGSEAIINQSMRWISDGEIYYANQAVVEPDGGYIVNVQYREFARFKSNLNHPSEEGPVTTRLIQRVEAPPRLAGQMTLTVGSMDPLEAPNRAWTYNPGQRRVRRAPEYAYDAPTADGLMTRDQSDGFNGALDRYNWRLIGKKEMYIGYNGYIFQEDQSVVREEDIIQAGHVNQDLARYELHRVWVIEATVKPTERHLYPKRVLYVDEDSWLNAASDIYDSQGKLWRVQDSSITNLYTCLTMTTTFQANYDLASGRYAIEGLDNKYPPRDTTFYQPAEYWTPQRLRSMGIR